MSLSAQYLIGDGLADGVSGGGGYMVVSCSQRVSQS